MTNKFFAMACAFVFTITFGLTAFAEPEGPNPPPFNCHDGEGNEVDLSTACQSLSDAEAVAFCGSLSINVTKQVCEPYLDANAFSLCKQYVTADAEAYCGDFVDQEVAVQIENRMGEITNICGGDHSFTAVAVKLAEISNSCQQGQQQAAYAKNICEDSSVNSFNTAQLCKLSTSVNVECPNTTVIVDEKPADCRRCKTKRRYFKNGDVKLEVTRCRGCTFDAETSVNWTE